MKPRHAIFLAVLALTACGGGSSSSVPALPGSGSSTMTIGLVDGQLQISGDTITAVNLGIDKVEVVGGGSAAAVVASYTTPDVVNILNYTSTSSPLQFTGTIPAGNYSQIRFVLDSATTTISYIDANGVQHTDVPLAVPSATGVGFGGNSSADSGDGVGTAGVKVNVSVNAQSGGSEAFVVDFNAGQSIVLTGNGTFMMKPVLVATAQSAAGAITGTVKDQAGQPVVNAEVEAMQGGTVVNAGVTDQNGNFTINALPAGTYALSVQNQYTTQAGAQVTASGYDASVGLTLSVSGNVTVTAGQTAQAGAIVD